MDLHAVLGFAVLCALVIASSPNSLVCGTRVFFQEVIAGQEPFSAPPEAQRELGTGGAKGPVQNLSDEERNQFIEAHNEARGAVGTIPLAWSDELMNGAADAAGRYFDSACLITAERVVDQGENIFCGVDASKPQWNPRNAVNDWVQEKVNYHDDSNTCTPPGAVCDHFKQVVSLRSKKFGCAIAKDNTKMLVVCLYDPKPDLSAKPY